MVPEWAFIDERSLEFLESSIESSEKCDTYSSNARKVYIS